MGVGAGVGESMSPGRSTPSVLLPSLKVQKVSAGGAAGAGAQQYFRRMCIPQCPIPSGSLPVRGVSDLTLTKGGRKDAVTQVVLVLNGMWPQN